MKGSSPLKGYWTSFHELLYQGTGEENQAEEEPTQAKGMESFKMELEAPGGSAGLSPMELWAGCGSDVSANAVELLAEAVCTETQSLPLCNAQKLKRGSWNSKSLVLLPPRVQVGTGRASLRLSLVGSEAKM